MDEILTNDELDALLIAISNSTSDKSEEEVIEPKKIRTYDFKKPDKFSKDHLKTFQHIFDAYTKIASPTLSLKYDTSISFHISSLDQLSYEDFSKLIPENSTLGMVSLKPLQGFTILEFEANLIYSLINLLLGGKGDVQNQIRDFTRLEIPVVQNIMQNIIFFLREAFLPIVPIKPVLEKIETNSFFKQKLPSSEIILQVCLDVKIKEIEHTMNICIPYTSLEPVIPKFSNRNLDSNIEANRDNSQQIRKRKILDSCMIRTYSEFQAGTVFIQPSGDTEDISHEVNINLTSDARSNHYFKTIFKNFVRTAEVS